MGGTTEPISAKLKDTYRPGMELGEAIGVAVEGLQTVSAANNSPTPEVLAVSALEVAVLDRTRPRRTFRRITERVLRDLLPEANRGESGVRSGVGGDDAPAGSGAVNGTDTGS
jgi:proteasome alpha subunit